MDFPPVDERSWVIATVAAHSDIVKLEVRSVSEVTVRNQYVADVTREIRARGVSCVEMSRGHTHTSILIYKIPQVKNLIDAILSENIQSDILSNWIFGKLFGYSDSEIWRYIEKGVG